MLIGHRAQAAAFLDAWQSGRMPHAWLLAGAPGLGKRRFADAAVAHVLADAAGPRVAADELDISTDHPTARLIAAGSHVDMRIITREVRERTGDLAAGITIDQIRGLQPLLHSTPALSAWRAIIIDSIDDLARPAANALLKSLEEPPPTTLFMLVSHSPGRLLPTIRSRCRLMRFQSLADADVDRVIAAQAPDLGVAERQALLSVAQGAPGQALRYAGLDIGGLMEAIDAIEYRGNAIAITALSRTLSAKAAQQRYEAFLEIAPARIRQRAMAMQGTMLAEAIVLWEKARDLASSAVPLSLDPQSVIFELAGMLASLGRQTDRETSKHG